MKNLSANRRLPAHNNPVAYLGPKHESSHSVKIIKEQDVNHGSWNVTIYDSRLSALSHLLMMLWTLPCNHHLLDTLSSHIFMSKMAIYSGDEIPGSYTTHNAKPLLRRLEPSLLSTCKIQILILVSST